MDFGALPPEIISGQMYSGPGAGPMLAAAAAWEQLAAELHSTATACSSVIASLAESWRGPSAAAMSAAAQPYLAWISATAAEATGTAAQATAAATAYQDAFAATVPPPMIAANRSQLASLLATNVFGQNTAAIAATEAQYAEMWLQDTTAMYSYAAAAAAAAPATPFSAPPQTADPARSAAPPSALPNAAAGTANQLNTSLAGADTFLGGLVGSSSASALYEDMFGAFAAAGKMSTFANASMSVPNMGMVQFKTFYKPAVSIVDIPASSLGAALRAGAAPVSSGLAGTVSAGAAEANLVGRLSVPPSWASATPAIRLAATGLADGNPAAAVPAADASRGLLAPMALGSLAGGALGGSAPRLINATGGQHRTSGAKPGKSPVRLDRVIAQLQQRPNSVQHWNVDQAGLDDLITELSKKPGVHAVHLSAGK